MKPKITENLPQFKATDEEIQALIKARHLDEKGMTIILITGVAQAQLDADVLFYGPLIQQARRESYDAGYAKAVKDNQDIIGQREVFCMSLAEQRMTAQKEVQQAKVAREMVEEIEQKRKPFTTLITGDQQISDWQSLKSKWGQK